MQISDNRFKSKKTERGCRQLAVNVSNILFESEHEANFNIQAL